MRVVACTVTLRSGPESGVSVITVPLMALTAPMRRLARAGAGGLRFAGRGASHGRRAPEQMPAPLAAQSAIARTWLGSCVHTPLLIYIAHARKTAGFTKFYFVFSYLKNI